MGGLQMMGLDLPLRRELVKMMVEDKTRCFSIDGRGSYFADLKITGFEGGRDLIDGQVQSYNFMDEETGSQ